MSRRHPISLSPPRSLIERFTMASHVTPLSENTSKPLSRSRNGSYLGSSYGNDAAPRSPALVNPLDGPHCKPQSDEKVCQIDENYEVRRYQYEDEEGEMHEATGVSTMTSASARNSSSGTKSDHEQESIKNSKEEDICTIAVLRRQIMCDCLVIVKRYRPQLKAYSLEFPVSSVDTSMFKVEDEAKHELEVETGYKAAQVKHVSPMTSTDPDLTDGKVKLVSVLVDGDDPILNAPRKNGTGKNGTEILQVPVNGLLDRLDEYTRQGCVIDSRVYAFAIGLKKGEKLVKGEVVPDEGETL